MKYVKKLTLLSVLTFILTGCGRTPSDGSVVSSSVSSHQQESTFVSSKEEESSTFSSSEYKTTVPEETSSVLEDNSSVTEESQWGNELAQLMKEHLNDTVLPFVTMVAKKEKIFYEWNEEKSLLSIIGGVYLEEYLTEAKQIFADAGYVVGNETENSIILKLDSKGVEVHFYEDSDGYVVLDASLTDVFDPSQFTSWSQDILALFQSKINGNVLPLVYLGTAVPTGKAYTDSLEILGGDYDQRILGLAKTTLTTAGWALADDDNEEQVKASKTMDDGWWLQVTVMENNRHEAEMDVVWKAPVIIPTTGSWNSTTSSLMDAHLGGHILPYIYLNTSNESSIWSSYDKDIEICGGAYDASLIVNAKNVLVSDGWTEVSYTTDSISYQKTFSDGQVNVRVEEDTFSHYIYLYASYEAVETDAYPVPEEATAWSSSTTALFNQYFASYPLPYLYLGAYPETSEYDDDYYYCVVVTGGEYNENVLGYAKPILETDGFSVEIKDGTYSTSAKRLTATKSDENHTYQVVITRSGSNTVLRASLVNKTGTE